EVVVPGRDAADVDRLALLGRNVDVAPAVRDALEHAQGTRPVTGAFALDGLRGPRTERRGRRAGVARQAENALVFAQELDPGKRPELVALERQQVPVAVRGIDVVSQPTDSVHALESTTVELDQLCGAHRP